MVDFVTQADILQSVPAQGQQVVLLTAYSGTAATTGTTSARVRAAAKNIQITVSNITAVNVATQVAVQASNDPTAVSAPTTALWTTLTTVTASATTVTTYVSTFTDTIPWNFYRANTTANASTNTMQVVLSF